jgi:hypothetical protein
MISKVVNISIYHEKEVYHIGTGVSGDLWSTKTCRLFPAEIDFINKAERDYSKAQEILKKNYTEWEKNLSNS